MKKILITGAGSYIGTCFASFMEAAGGYTVDTVDMIGDAWKQTSFAGYDAVFHVAGIAHQKETAENAHLYYEVNRDLAVETAKKAKAEGVKQFVFLSSMSVYGMEEGCITLQTQPQPKTNYGKSKLQAEEGMLPLVGDGFKIAVLRPPMVYGPGCKGNYQSLVKIADKLPIFPNYKNKRSVISIDRLCSYVKEVIDSEADGLHLPQDSQYACTSQMVKQIADEKGKKIRLWSVLNPLVSLAKCCTTAGKKAFGDLYYQ